MCYKLTTYNSCYDDITHIKNSKLNSVFTFILIYYYTRLRDLHLIIIINYYVQFPI